MKYVPLDNFLGARWPVDTSVEACQARCESHPECSFFSFWAKEVPKDNGCHLFGSAATFEEGKNIGQITGPSFCSGTPESNLHHNSQFTFEWTDEPDEERPLCEPVTQCYDGDIDPKGLKYDGCANTTVSGRTCQVETIKSRKYGNCGKLATLCFISGLGFQNASQSRLHLPRV